MQPTKVKAGAKYKILSEAKKSYITDIAGQKEIDYENMKNQQNINDILAKIEEDWIHEKLFSMQLKIANSQIKALQ